MHILHATRYNTGAYLCIASNGVPPTVSKRITVVVNCKIHYTYMNVQKLIIQLKNNLLLVPPKIWVQNRHMFTPMGQKVTLECHTESNPNSINYWMRSNGDVAHQGNVLKVTCIANN